MHLSGIPAYKDFLQLSKKYDNSSLLLNAGQYLKSLADIKQLQTKQSPVVFLLDFTSQKYVFMHKNVEQATGYSANYYMEGGLDFYLSNWDKEDFDIYNKQIFPESLKFSSEYPFEKNRHLVFSRNNRLKTRDGDSANLLQRFCFIIDPLIKNPVGVIGSVTDITHFKRDNLITQTIEEIDSDNPGSPKKLLFKKTYFLDEGKAALTKKELEVLRWICEGLSSKQIAYKMQVSIFTIHNHRKNMLQKTECKNAAELLHYAINRGFL